MMEHFFNPVNAFFLFSQLIVQSSRCCYSRLISMCIAPKLFRPLFYFGIASSSVPLIFYIGLSSEPEIGEWQVMCISIWKISFLIISDLFDQFSSVQDCILCTSVYRSNEGIWRCLKHERDIAMISDIKMVFRCTPALSLVNDELSTLLNHCVFYARSRPQILDLNKN